MTRIEWASPATYVYRLNPPNEDKINVHFSTGTEILWSPTVDDIMAVDWADTVRAD